MRRCFCLLSLLTLLSAGLSPIVAADQNTPKKRPQAPAFLKDTPEEFIKRFDKNKDGFLTRDELPPFLARVFDRVDTNGDGKLDKQEVATLLQVLRRRFAQGNNQPAARPQVDRLVNSILQRMDKDMDGRISKKEAMGRLAVVFDQFDTNKDGFLDKQELRQVARRFLANRGGGAGARPNPNTPDFDALDLNADGRLTREELKGTRFASIFDQIDTNKDGKIDRKEFEAYLKKTAK